MEKSHYILISILFIIVFTSIFSLVILDADGVTITEEFKHNTNPIDSDTDNDGLTDYEELHIYNTDPTNNDTDNDSLIDGKEVHKYNTIPTEKDTDNDGLTDYEELHIYNTDPTNFDTDGDSISDGEEVYNSEDYPNSDPLHKDIYIEVDYSGSYNQSKVKEIISPVEEMYADAPVTNPDGSTGINLHTQIDNTSVSSQYLNVTRRQYNYSPNATDLFGNDLKNHTVVYSKINVSDYTKTINSSFKNKDKSGYYQITYVDFICRNGDECMSTASGMAYIYNNSTVVATKNPSTTAHEIGHLLGLLHGNYHGIDSEEVPPSEYPSVMNYNYNKHSPFDNYTKEDYNYTLQYSDGKGHNDWEEINRTIANDCRSLNCKCYI